MTKTRAMILVCFLAAFAAGVGVGLVAWQRPHKRTRHSTLMRELNLTPEQRTQMREIWSGLRGAMRRDRRKRRDALREERNDAIRSLLNENQVPKYEDILQEYSRKMDELAEQRKKRFDEAVKRTKSILTEEQRAKYEELLKKRRKDGPPPRAHRPPGGKPVDGGTGPRAKPQREE